MLSALAVLGACKDGTGPRHGDPARIESEAEERVVWPTDRFLLLSRRFVYELTP